MLNPMYSTNSMYQKASIYVPLTKVQFIGNWGLNKTISCEKCEDVHKSNQEEGRGKKQVAYPKSEHKFETICILMIIKRFSVRQAQLSCGLYTYAHNTYSSDDTRKATFPLQNNNFPYTHHGK